MSLETGQAEASGLLQERLLRVVDITALGHAEADVHVGPDRLIGDDAVDVGVRIEDAVDEGGLLAGDGLLTVDLVREGL